MHGVQPTAKIAPSPNDASQPPRADQAPAEAIGRCPAAARACERDRTGRGRERPGRAGIERPPRPFERRDAQDAGKVQPEDHEDDAADRAQRAQVVDQGARQERGGHPSSVNTVPNPAT